MKRDKLAVLVAVVVAIVLLLPFVPSLRASRNFLASFSLPQEFSAPASAPQTPVELAHTMDVYRALPKPAACRAKKVLVLYGTKDRAGDFGEIYALYTANLAGRWADYKAEPIGAYHPGEMSDYALTVFIGNSYGEIIPKALAADVAEGSRPVLWLNYGLDDLAKLIPDFAQRYGMTPGLLDHRSFARVDYHGVAFKRRDIPGGDDIGELATVRVTEPAKVEILAIATAKDGGQVPWAFHTGNLTVIAENPFVFAAPTSPYLILADVMTRLLAPDAPDRHRAMVRIEDVGPDADPAALKAIAEYLGARRVPFSVAVFDTFADPHDTDPVMARYDTMAENPEFVAALKDMASRGGTLVMHGHTHQLGGMNNPYSAKSGADFEFFRAHVDVAGNVVWDGPDARDSLSWANDRIRAGLDAWQSAGLPRPAVFEFPHYAASPLDYAAAGRLFQARYEQEMVYTGMLGPVDARRAMFRSQFFPYPVRDVYGAVVLPEDMGNYTPHAFSQHHARQTGELLDIAAHDWVLKDGFASFYFHWQMKLEKLKAIVEPMQAKGWQFVDPAGVIAETACR